MSDKSKSIKGCFTSVSFDQGFCFVISSLLPCRNLNIYGQELGQNPGMSKCLLLCAGDKEKFRLLNMKQITLSLSKWAGKTSTSKESSSAECAVPGWAELYGSSGTKPENPQRKAVLMHRAIACLWVFYFSAIHSICF